MTNDDTAMAVQATMNRSWRYDAWNLLQPADPGDRIGISFSHVDTMLEHDGTGNVVRVSGRGAPPNGGAGMSLQELINAWAMELTTNDDNWEGWYGRGFQGPEKTL